jgi:hypothetical protein
MSSSSSGGVMMNKSVTLPSVGGGSTLIPLNKLGRVNNGDDGEDGDSKTVLTVEDYADNLREIVPTEAERSAIRLRDARERQRVAIEQILEVFLSIHFSYLYFFFFLFSHLSLFEFFFFPSFFCCFPLFFVNIIVPFKMSTSTCETFLFMHACIHTCVCVSLSLSNRIEGRGGRRRHQEWQRKWRSCDVKPTVQKRVRV